MKTDLKRLDWDSLATKNLNGKNSQAIRLWAISPAKKFRLIKFLPGKEKLCNQCRHPAAFG
jgi:hypothetical protein